MIIERRLRTIDALPNTYLFAFLKRREFRSKCLWDNWFDRRVQATVIFNWEATFAKRNIARQIYIYYSILLNCSVPWSDRVFCIFIEEIYIESRGRIKVLTDRKVTLKSKGCSWLQLIITHFIVIINQLAHFWFLT